MFGLIKSEYKNKSFKQRENSFLSTLLHVHTRKLNSFLSCVKACARRILKPPSRLPTLVELQLSALSVLPQTIFHHCTPNKKVIHNKLYAHPLVERSGKSGYPQLLSIAFFIINICIYIIFSIYPSFFIAIV